MPQIYHALIQYFSDDFYGETFEPPTNIVPSKNTVAGRPKVGDEMLNV